MQGGSLLSAGRNAPACSVLPRLCQQGTGHKHGAQTRDGSRRGARALAPWSTRPASLGRISLPQRRQCGRSQAAAGDGGGASGGGGGSGDGGGGGGDGDDEDDDELLDKAQADELAAARGVKLPADFIEAAINGGLRKSALLKYIALQAGGIGGWLAARMPAVRDRLIADPQYLFKCGVEVVIDSGCATVAEVRKRGDDFWKEFEFYLSDLVVGLVLDVAMVTLLTPVAVIGAKSRSSEMKGFKRYLAGLPSAMCEKSIPGVKKYKVTERMAGFVVKGLEYSLSGMAAAFVGQGVANLLMVARRKLKGGAGENDVEVPDLFRTALVWGLFMGVSSNTRYQIVFGLERVVDGTVARRLPALSRAATVGIRFVNNVIGGENFIDMARWAGVQ